MKSFFEFYEFKLIRISLYGRKIKMHSGIIKFKKFFIKRSPLLVLISILTFSLFIFHSPLFSEASEDLESKPLKNKKLSAYFQYNSGKSVSTTEKGKINDFKIAIELYFLSHFSLGFGLSKSKINLQDSTWNSNLIIGGLLIASSASNPANTPQEQQDKKGSNLIGLIFLSGPTQYNYNPTNLNFDFNLHWNTESFIDPYLGLGYQFGVASNSESFSTLSGWKAQGGVKINFSSYYLFLQGEYQKVKINDSFFISPFNLTNKVMSFGIGYYFQ